MKTLLTFLFLLLIGNVLFGQTTVTGTFKDDVNGEPITGVNVIVVGKTIGTVTNWDGKFTLIVDQAPPFKIKASMIGFEPQTFDITQNNQIIDFSLQVSETELNEVIISASRTPERVMESPVTIERMDIKDIKKTASVSFYDGLENLKGVDVLTSSVTFKSVNTRGFATFNNNRFVQLVDGMDNSSPAMNFNIGNMLGMSELDVNTVEILPGASSALYGANAYNGIMFMESKSPFDYQGISFYAKSGVTTQKAAGTNEFVDVGIRLAKAFSNKFAAKGSLSFLNGKEWYANDYMDYYNPGFTRDNPAYDGLNVYGDEVSTVLNFKNLALASGVPPAYANMFGTSTVSRTGYNEIDLMDYNAESLKTDVSLNYRPKGDDLEIIVNSKFGMGNTIYQGANRYSIQNFYLYQNKLEIKSNNFFVRGYMTGESAGDSYDSRFAAINVNRSWKSDPQWFTEYAKAYIGGRLGQIPGMPMLDDNTAHKVARQVAQTGALVPGTSAFNDAFNKVISDPNMATGAKFVDRTSIYHVDANYNFRDIIEFAEIQVGGSWRKYALNSEGTIFTDYDGKITYNEIGAYAQLQKKMVDDRLKFTGSLRYDKAEQFDGHISPRVSLAYAAGATKNHNLRFSYQTGFRNPTTQDLYIGLDVGRAILVGSAPDNLDRYTSIPINVSLTGQALGNPATVILSGRRAYDNAFSYSSVIAKNPQKSNIELVKPENVKAFELGYRGLVGGITFDFSAFYNSYVDFIGTKTVIVPLYGNADLSDQTQLPPAMGGVKVPTALLALNNGDYKPFQVYTNSEADVSSTGLGIGISRKFFKDYEISMNYTWSDYQFDQESDPDYEAGFNTPEHKFKASLGSPHVFKNVGFNVSYRYNSSYYWESSFVDGDVPANSVFDAQINYTIRKLKSVIKVGGVNIAGNEYFSAPGTGHIGSQYYATWTVTL